MFRAASIPLVLALGALSAGCDKKDSTPSEAPANQDVAPQKASPASNEQADAPTAPAAESASAVEFYPTLMTTLEGLLGGFDAIPSDRKAQLKKIADYVSAKRAGDKSAELLFICTHNSRRSHLSQIWAATAAAYYGVDGVKTYSGGTEATAFNFRAVATVGRAGFRVSRPPEEANPHYDVKFGRGAPAQECFSKKYSDAFNPQSGFAAVMTCSQADASCPTVQGAEARFSLPYVDPKVSDGTPEEGATYDARSNQIGTEMLYLFSLVDGAKQ